MRPSSVRSSTLRVMASRAFASSSFGKSLVKLSMTRSRFCFVMCWTAPSTRMSRLRRCAVQMAPPAGGPAGAWEARVRPACDRPASGGEPRGVQGPAGSDGCMLGWDGGRVKGADAGNPATGALTGLSGRNNFGCRAALTDARIASAWRLDHRQSRQCETAAVAR